MAEKKTSNLAAMHQERQVKVECYSGYKYPERPCSFTWQGRMFKIARIEKEWLEPDGRFFRVLTEGEDIYELCYNETEDRWWLKAQSLKEKP